MDYNSIHINTLNHTRRQTLINSRIEYLELDTHFENIILYKFSLNNLFTFENRDQEIPDLYTFEIFAF